MSTPLVSVVVITYNSAKTVIETLDSIYNQTYPNIELIISDDCSKDNTLEICEKWIRKNANRFFDIQIIRSEKNTGVSANGNRGYDACKSTYCKAVAGDDLLKPKCIESYVGYIIDHPGAIVIFGKVELVGGIEKTRKKFEEIFDYNFFNLNIEQQLKYLLEVRNCIPASTEFVNLEKMRLLGIRNDERIPMMDDYPKWINYLHKGVRFHFIDEETVGYRLDSGVSTGEKPLCFRKSERLFFIYYQLEYFLSTDKKRAYSEIIKYEMSLIDALEKYKNIGIIKIMKKFYNILKF